MIKADSNHSCARLLKALGEPKRLAMVRLIFQKPYCVQDIERALDLPQYEVSRHLAVLRRAGLVEAKRDAQRTYYQIHPEVKLDQNEFEFGCCRISFPKETPDTPSS
jgi:ArsR family transcriptional regulator